jgi:hypothetical protein
MQKEQAEYGIHHQTVSDNQPVLHLMPTRDGSKQTASGEADEAIQTREEFLPQRWKPI